MVVGSGSKVLLLALFTETWRHARILLHRYWCFEDTVYPSSR